jgi:hypothetical protein
MGRNGHDGTATAKDENAEFLFEEWQTWLPIRGKSRMSLSIEIGNMQF